MDEPTPPGSADPVEARASEGRYRQDVHREYAGAGITVHWEPALCIHVANCIRSLPAVFDPEARPWVAVAAAGADEIARAIETCPTGALRYSRTDGAPQEQAEVPTTVEPRPNGPLFVRGELEVIGADRQSVRHATRLALCRCGHSQNKPYCDLSHRLVGFQG